MAGVSLGCAMSVVGNSINDPCGFYGVAGTTQRASANQAALASTTVLQSGFGFATSAAFAAFTAQLEEMRATMVAMGLMKGSA